MDCRSSIFDCRFKKGHGCQPVRLLAREHSSFVTRHSSFASGFTLVELLVTCALVTVLMLACAQVFSIASKTIGGGQALGAAVRDAQAAQAVFARDFAAVAPRSPAFVIRSKRVAAFRNLNDGRTDVDTNSLTYDLRGTDDVNIAADFRNFLYNFRNHRTDYLLFFARDRFQRQTGNFDSLVAPQAAREAVVHYHHLCLPHTNGNFYLSGATNAASQPDPGAQGSKRTNPGNFVTSASNLQDAVNSNPQNFFATQWILGRAALLLVDLGKVQAWDTTKAYRQGQLVQHGGELYLAIADSTGANPSSSSGAWERSLYYQRSNTLTPLDTTAVANDGSSELERIRTDLADTDIDSFRYTLTTWIDTTPNDPWWLRLMADRRFEVNPFVTRPLNPATASQQAPIFLPASTQFIVEFAGDFLEQDPMTGAVADVNGNGTALEPDNVVDFVASTKQIRWYGLPRDTSADGRIVGDEGDVVPLRDVANARFPFERRLPNATSHTAPENDQVVATNTDYYTSTTASTTDPEYVVAWGPRDTNRPKMIRITIVIDRPEAEGKLLDGQSFEYVFNVGY